MRATRETIENPKTGNYLTTEGIRGINYVCFSKAEPLLNKYHNSEIKAELSV